MQVQDIQDIPMEINYTLTEPQNDYWTDIYSPWQTKLQLEIWQEVRPEKVKIYSNNVHLKTTENETKIIRFRTKSKNRSIEFLATNLYDMKQCKWLLINNINNQRTWRVWLWDWYTEGSYEKWKIFDFDNCEWKIIKLLPWWFDLEIKWTFWVILNFEAHNIPFNIY